MSIPNITSYLLPAADELPANKVNWVVDSQRAVLLVHDMQDYFLRFYGADSPLMRTLVDNIVRLYQWAKQQGIPVVYTAQPVEQSDAERALLNDMWGPGLTKADPEQCRIVQAIAPAADDTVLVKWRYSAFQRSDLQEKMRAWQRDQLIIVGVYAHIGCLTTALDAFMRDIQPFMVADAVADFSRAEHAMALKYVAGRCGAVTSTQALLNSAGNQALLTREGLQARLLQMLDLSADDFDGDELLVDYGLDSVQVMQLIGEWDKAGIRVQFEELARHATFNAWWELLSRRQAAKAA